jgi:hypothetical protein
MILVCFAQGTPYVFFDETFQTHKNTKHVGCQEISVFYVLTSEWFSSIRKEMNLRANMLSL